MTSQPVAMEPSAFSGEASDTLRLLGLLLLQNGRPARAAMVFDALSAMNDDDQQLKLSHACALIRSGDPSKALSVLEHVFPNPADPAVAWLLRGQALSLIGKPLEAARAMRMFIRHRQTDG